MRTVAILLGAVLGLTTAFSHAQTYPARPLRMVVGFPPGGGNDIMARIVASKFGELLAQPVVVENRPGNAGVIGAEAVAKAAGIKAD